MSQTPKPKKQEWVEYLLDTIGKEGDPVVSQTLPRWLAIRDDYSEGILSRELALEAMLSQKEMILPFAAATHRTEKLLDATIKYILDPDLKIDRGLLP